MATRDEELRIRIRLDDTGQITAQLGGVEKQIQKTGTAGKDASGGLLSLAGGLGSLKSLLPALGIGAVVGSVISLGKEALDTAGGISDMADRTGVGAEAIQELRFAADQAGVAAGGMDRALEGFSRRVGEARDGTGSLVSALKNQDVILLRQIQTAGSTEKALDLVFRKIAETTDATERARLANAAFGRSGIELLPMLSQGAAGLDLMRQRARDLGVVMSAEMVQAGDAAGDRLGELGTVIRGNLNRALVEAAPLIEDVATGLTNLTVGAVSAIAKLNELIADTGRIAQNTIQLEADYGSVDAARERLVELQAAIDAIQEKGTGIFQDGEFFSPKNLLQYQLELAKLNDLFGITKAEIEAAASSGEKMGSEGAAGIGKIDAAIPPVISKTKAMAGGFGAASSAVVTFAEQTVRSLNDVASLDVLDTERLSRQVDEAIAITEDLDGIRISFDEEFLKQNMAAIRELVERYPESIPEEKRRILLQLIADDTSARETMAHLHGEISAFQRDASQGITFPLRADPTEARQTVLNLFDEINAKAEGLLLLGGRKLTNAVNEVTGTGNSFSFGIPNPKEARREFEEIRKSGTREDLEAFADRLGEIASGLGRPGGGPATATASGAVLLFNNPFIRFLNREKNAIRNLALEARGAAGSATGLSSSNPTLLPQLTQSNVNVNFAPLERAAGESNLHLSRIAGGFDGLRTEIAGLKRSTDEVAKETRQMKEGWASGRYAAPIVGAASRSARFGGIPN